VLLSGKSTYYGMLCFRFNHLTSGRIIMMVCDMSDVLRSWERPVNDECFSLMPLFPTFNRRSLTFALVVKREGLPSNEVKKTRSGHSSIWFSGASLPRRKASILLSAGSASACGLAPIFSETALSYYYWMAFSALDKKLREENI